MKTLYLHIGTPKTATTAIQNFCCDNNELLMKKGYIYPMFKYRFMEIQPTRNAHFMLGELRVDSENQRRKNAEMFQEGFQKIYSLFKTYDNVILSDEGIWNHGFLGKECFWEQFRKEIEKNIFQVKIIVYLRRQDEFLYSWWNQQIKEGTVKTSKLLWSEVVERKPTIQLDYYSVISKIAAIVGKQNIVIREFDKKKFLKGNIYADFLDVLHLDDEGFEVKQSVQNTSLSKDNIEIKRLLNCVSEMDPFINRRFREVLEKLSVEQGIKDNMGMFSEEENEKFLATYKEGNEKLAKEYLGLNSSLFTDEYFYDVKWEFHSKEILEKFIILFAEMCNEQHKEQKALEEEITILKKRLDDEEYRRGRMHRLCFHPVKTIKGKMRALIKRSQRNE